MAECPLVDLTREAGELERYLAWDPYDETPRCYTAELAGRVALQLVKTVEALHSPETCAHCRGA